MPPRSQNLSRDQKAAKIRRAQARRSHKRQEAKVAKLIEAARPIEEWDIEELARGRPRDKNGGWKGKSPSIVSAAVFEEAIKRFKDMTTADIRALVPSAVQALQELIEDRETDDKGRYIIPPSVRMAAAQWVIEHLVGKPTQRIEGDISVKLQGILANVMVSPDEVGDGNGLKPAIDVESWVEDEEDADLGPE